MLNGGVHSAVLSAWQRHSGRCRSTDAAWWELWAPGSSERSRVNMLADLGRGTVNGINDLIARD